MPKVTNLYMKHADQECNKTDVFTSCMTTPSGGTAHGADERGGGAALRVGVPRGGRAAARRRARRHRARARAAAEAQQPAEGSQGIHHLLTCTVMIK